MSEFLVRDSRQPGHFWADNEVVDVFGNKIGWKGLLVYMILARHAINGTGQVCLSCREIGSQAGISHQSASRGIAALKENGLIETVKEYTNREEAIYALADIKALVDPDYRQLKLSNGQRSPQEHSVPRGSTGVPSTSTAFPRGARNKERKTTSILNTKTEASPKNPRCKKHPNSALTGWGSCWDCYAEKYSAEIGA